jgi:hypothetical protein
MVRRGKVEKWKEGKMGTCERGNVESLMLLGRMLERLESREGGKVEVESTVERWELGKVKGRKVRKEHEFTEPFTFLFRLMLVYVGLIMLSAYFCHFCR